MNSENRRARKDASGKRRELDTKPDLKDTLKVPVIIITRRKL